MSEGSPSENHDGIIKLWNSRTAEQLHTFSFEPRRAAKAITSPDDRVLLAGCEVRDLASGQCLARFETEGLPALMAIHPDGRMVAGTNTGSVCLLRLHAVHLGPPKVTAIGGPDGVAVSCPYCQAKTQAIGRLDQDVECAGCGKSMRLNPFVVS